MACSPTPPPDDLAVLGGLVIDGTGAPAREADLAVRDGVVVALGALPPERVARARRVVDATGLAVAPGFIDLHSHADLILLADLHTQERLLDAKLRQGVTTVVVGNCGLGVAPSDARSAGILAAVNGWMTPEGVEPGPLDVAGYLERLERNGVAVNVATLVPHGPVRISVMGLREGAPSATELEAMRSLVRDGLDAGAFGLSSGLIYPPGMYSATDELAALAREVAAVDGLYTSHVRGSSELLARATDELIEIGVRTGVRVHHSHLEAVGRSYWPEIEDVLEREDRARAEGVAISHDVFPYTRAATMMSAIFPPWALAGGVDGLLERLRDPAARAKVRRAIEEDAPRWPPWTPGGWPHNLVRAVRWDGIRIASVPEDGPTEWVGRSLGELGAALGREPFDVVADLMVEHDGRVGQWVDEISGADEALDALWTIVVHPAGAVISDAEDYGRGRPHPAHAGAFARALRMARERGVPSLEAIVHKMTGRPASILGLERRGTLAVGHVADLVLFDPERVSDRATWDRPRAPAEGIVEVIVQSPRVLRRRDASAEGEQHHDHDRERGDQAADEPRDARGLAG